MSEGLPTRGAVFWPVGTGDSTTIVIDDQLVVQVDLHDMAKADDESTPEVPVVDELVDALPLVNGVPYLAVFALTHADKDHCLGFADLLSKVTIGELWATPRLWREYTDDPDAPDLCADARAFQVEAERRVLATQSAVNAGEDPISGNRILIVGFDADHSKYGYDALPDKYFTGPGKVVTSVDGVDCTGRFEAFIHAPFAADAAAARNDTSLAMQVTLIDESGQAGKLLLLGDLAHDTIMKIFSYSESHDRSAYVDWDLLLAPHHCSKRVMYLRSVDGTEDLQSDVMDALERHGLPGSTIISSSAVFPDEDADGANPPHRMAADRYAEIADELINTMSWLDLNNPSPVVFGVSASGAGVVRDETVELAAEAAISKRGLAVADSRLGLITAAATLVAESVAAARGVAISVSGPERIDRAVAEDRGGREAPATAVGFGK